MTPTDAVPADPLPLDAGVLNLTRDELDMLDAICDEGIEDWSDETAIGLRAKVLALRDQVIARGGPETAEPLDALNAHTARLTAFSRAVSESRLHDAECASLWDDPTQSWDCDCSLAAQPSVPRTDDGPFIAYFTTHGEGWIVTDRERPAQTRIATVSTDPDDYGRANTLLIADALNRLAASTEGSTE